MSLNQWNTEKIKQYEYETGQALLSDEQTLVSFSQDFGKLIQSPPAAVFIPQTTDALQTMILFANQHKLPITIRGNGLSQCGQSLPVPGGLTLSMQHFMNPLEMTDDSIWVEANTSWANLLQVTLQNNKAPFVLPYNCNLSIAGVLSAGGVGASSFKYGAINAHVRALEVVDGLGVKHLVESNSPLFQACLSGQGRFAVITKACIQLRPIKALVKTVCLVYTDQEQWFIDIEKAKGTVDYMEMFCSPSIQGAKLAGDKRVPLVEWLYGLHLSVEYEKNSPELSDVIANLDPWRVINTQEEYSSAYLLRHNSRFEVMKMLGQWDLYHPWYECFISTAVLKEHLPSILQELPVHYASLVHVVPMAKKKGGFLMLPEDDSICSFMILNPGVPSPLKDSCLQAIQDLDKRFIQLGGKRYLSGFLGTSLPEHYWENHFGERHTSWIDLKNQFDPQGIFQSMLHPH
ncbi:FAD-binding oxidoreductase [Legionella bononiensis]|uniref:FAD-binding oxidoreductase n=1 Tax=Legionella bononiensis TaxID=2793102 RepID=A0ABS1W8B8_9GAMM|nr:FAD-binding oxidoreductase [Legionella bononiensis]MBL7479872.1 FAD-binding oxidoreductase [Legionella bononiensis]MBL7525613.1 FAD-binding oxidoreductase [Legionella bononiensis]MBL7561796.1 FAD-binding oxidoreductase [Legionella bononiensis]